MPPVAVAAASAAALSVGSGVTITAAGALAFTAPAWGSVAFAAAMGGASAFLQSALAPKPPGDPGVQISSRQALAPAQIIYGETKVGGVFAFQGNGDRTNPADRDWLNLVIVWAGHEVESIDEIWHGNDLIWLASDGTAAGHDNTGEGDTRKAAAEAADPPQTFKRAPRDYSENVLVYNREGTPNQAAITAAVNNIEAWTTDHRLRGCAYSYIRMKFDRRQFPQGLKNITARIKGKKVFDPRLGSDESVVAYSSNPALCLRDFLTTFCGLTGSQVNDTQMGALANICDEQVATTSNGDQDRYQISAVADETQSREEVIGLMLATMNARGAWIAGQFYINGGAYAAPTVALTEDDMRGPIKFATRRGRRDRWNLVKGRYAGARDAGNRTAYTPREYPQKSSATMLADDGEELALIWDLLYCPHGYLAQRLAKMKLLQSRQEITATIQVGIEAIEAVATGSMTLTNSRLGWDEKEFEIVEFSIGASADGPAIEMSIRETSEAIWEWETDEEADDIAGDPTSLENAFETANPVIGDVTEVLSVYRQEVITTMIADVTGAENVERFEVQARVRPALPPSVDTAGPWRAMSGTGSENRFELVNVDDGQLYDIRARAISGLGIASDWVEKNSAHTVVGKLEPPADVTDLRVETNKGRAILNWSPTPDLDLSHYIVRHQAVTTSGLWSEATTIAERIARPATSVALAAQVGTYFIKAVDKIGKVSENAASFVLLDTGESGFVDITSITDTTFAGPKTDTNTSVPGGGLALDKTGDDFDAIGYYYNGTTFDFGASYLVKLTGVAEFTRYEDSALMDSFILPIDSYLSLWDDIGITSSEDDIEVRIEVKHTDDDPAGSPTWSAWKPFTVTELSGRGFQFRIALISTTAVATPLVTELSIIASMERRTDSGTGQQPSGTGYDDIVYANEFYSEPAVQITPRTNGTNALDAGDWYAIEDDNTDETGFRVIFKTSGGSDAITRDFNWSATGVGRKTS